MKLFHPTLPKMVQITIWKISKNHWISHAKKRDRHSPKNALGEMMPVLLATTMAMPVSKKGTVNSTAVCRSELILMEVTTISALWWSSSAISPFHVPFCYGKNRKWGTVFWQSGWILPLGDICWGLNAFVNDVVGWK